MCFKRIFNGFLFILFSLMYTQEEFLDDVDLYDDVIAAPSSEPHDRIENTSQSNAIMDRGGPDGMDQNNGFAHIGNNLAPNHIGRRHQLYVGNLTWVSVLSGHARAAYPLHQFLC